MSLVKLEVNCNLLKTKFEQNSVYAGGVHDWKLVRSVPEGTTWHPATDGLQGSDVYGDETDLTQTFSKKYDDQE